jgi:hypothetical protein
MQIIGLARISKSELYSFKLILVISQEMEGPAVNKSFSRRQLMEMEVLVI